MGLLEDESEDSRTSAIGKKRDLADLEMPKDSPADYSDNSVGRPHKRAKQDAEASSSEPVKDEIILNTPLQSSSDLPEAGISQIPSIDLSATAAIPSMTWNKGVQSGVRISFGSRGLSLSKALTAVHRDRQGDISKGSVEAKPQTDNPQHSTADSSRSNLHLTVDSGTRPAQPDADDDADADAEDTESAMPKAKKARKKKTRASESETNGGNAAKENQLVSSSTPHTPKDLQLPRLRPPEAKRIYENGRGEFVLEEVLQDNQQIRLNDLKAEVFVHHFLHANAQKLDSLSLKHLKGAFNSYLDLYYSHLPKHQLDKVRRSAATAEARALFTGALAQVKQSTKDNATTHNPKDGQNAELEVLHSLQDEMNDAPKDSEVGATDASQPPLADIGENDEHNTPQITKEVEREDGEMSSDGFDVALSDLEIELLEKYFPTVPGSITKPRCLACASSSHKTFDCPALTCNICHKSHLVSACPENVRCLKCRARGHPTKECPEKLSRTMSEGISCDLCQSPDHLEAACHLIWRSYHPKPEEIRTVRDIPISCYMCGASNHYGPECGLHSGTIRSGGLTWSKQNLQKYLDPSSSGRAISAGTDFSLPNPTKRIFSIKGQAHDLIMLDDSDEDVEFIRPSVKSTSSKSRPRGQSQHIHFASQISAKEPSTSSFTAINPPRQPRQHFAGNNGFQDSTRYGRERTSSPPPRFDSFRVGLNENDRYLPQGPARGDYRPTDGGRHPGPGDNGFRGGPPGRSRVISSRGGGNGRGKKRGKGS